MPFQRLSRDNTVELQAIIVSSESANIKHEFGPTGFQMCFSMSKLVFPPSPLDLRPANNFVNFFHAIISDWLVRRACLHFLQPQPTLFQPPPLANRSSERLSCSFSRPQSASPHIRFIVVCSGRHLPCVPISRAGPDSSTFTNRDRSLDHRNFVASSRNPSRTPFNRHMSLSN